MTDQQRASRAGNAAHPIETHSVVLSNPMYATTPHEQEDGYARLDPNTMLSGVLSSAIYATTPHEQEDGYARLDPNTMSLGVLSNTVHPTAPREHEDRYATLDHTTMAHPNHFITSQNTTYSTLDRTNLYCPPDLVFAPLQPQEISHNDMLMNSSSYASPHQFGDISSNPERSVYANPNPAVFHHYEDPDALVFSAPAANISRPQTGTAFEEPSNHQGTSS